MKETNISSEQPDRGTKSVSNYPSKKVLFVIIVSILLAIILVITLITLTIGANKYKILSAPAEEVINDTAVLSNLTTTKKSVITNLLPPEEPLPSVNFIERSQWGSNTSVSLPHLQHPTPVIIISHTASTVCNDVVKCSKRVQSIRSYHMTRQEALPDIGYNFLIGGDGNVYVGRGWDSRNFHSSDSVGISFIGNYVYDELTENMIQTTKNLLRFGVRSGKLSTSYKLLAHNQTAPTISPGANVYKVIKTWPHFDSSVSL